MSNSSKIERASAENFSERVQFHRELILWHMCHVLKSFFFGRVGGRGGLRYINLRWPTRFCFFHLSPQEIFGVGIFSASNLLFQLLSR